MRTSTKLVCGGLVFCWVGCGDLDSSASTADTGAPSAATVQSGLDRSSGGEAEAGPRCPRPMPAGLNPPAGATLEASMTARGVQIYVCATPVAGGAAAWTLKAPHAVLGRGRDTDAIHFAGPSWQALDGSLVTGAKLAAATPDPTAIPWLLLQAATNVGPGLFGDVTFIQRLDTVGGLAPSAGCDDGHLAAVVLVPYRASYFFYHATADARVRQCAAP